MSNKFNLQLFAPGFSSDINQELLGFNYIESMGGCSRWAMSFSTQDDSKYNSLLKNDELDFSFRFGTSMNTDGPQQSTLKHVRILHAKKRLFGRAKVIFTLRGTCSGIAIQKHRAKDKHWKDKRISEIVTDLLQDFDSLTPQIEKTRGKFSLMGCNLPTGSFIRRFLLPFAFGSKGTDWRFWVEDGKKVHFEPLKPKGRPYRFTNLFRDNWLKMKSPQVVKDTRFESELDYGKVEVVMLDPDHHRLIRETVSDKNSKLNYLARRGRPTPREHTARTRRLGLQQRRQTDVSPQTLVQNVSQTLWGRHSRSLYRLTGELDYEPGISVNHLAMVDLAGPFGAPDINTGMWVVHSVKHLYSHGSIRTWVLLEKRWEG